MKTTCCKISGNSCVLIDFSNVFECWIGYRYLTELSFFHGKDGVTDIFSIRDVMNMQYKLYMLLFISFL